MPAQTVIQVRRDSAANWESVDPTLAAGEIGFDTTNNQIKIGNGTDEWTVLEYASGGGGASVQVSDTAPSDPEVGNVWYNSAEGTSYIYYDSYWVPLTPAIVGPEGPEGPAGADGVDGVDGAPGADGATGATGPSGVISVTAPITNSGTSTEAVLGLDTSSILPAAPVNANTAKSAGYIGLPQNILASGGLTLSADHAGEHIYVTGTGQTITIPANASVPFEIGTTIVVINADAVTTSIAITSDTLLLAGEGTTGTRTLDPHGMATLVKITSTSWIISGNGLS